MHPPLIIDPGWLGSPLDAATFVVVITMFVYELRPRQQTVAAAVVALAEGRKDVDDDRLRAELGVDDRDVDELRPTIVCDGEASDE